MHNNLNLSLNKSLLIKTCSDTKEQLMVCSHERSGTHFLMNTMNIATTYCSNPWLNYDLSPLGANLNFFSEASTSEFIRSLSSLTINGKATCNISILKSHFPLSHLGEDASKLPLKIIYIWRDPAETLASLWQFMHRWSWNEGPKTETPLELAAAKPSGQSQRYQTSNYKDYFERWAAHLIDGLEHCQKNPKAYSVSYKKLLQEHTSTTEKICDSLNIKILKKPEIPCKNENVVKGASITICPDDKARLEEFCDMRLKEFPSLKRLF